MQKRWASTQKAFTLVELLIVIVVIAILASISVVAYNGVQDRAKTSAVHKDLADAKKKLMMFKVDAGRYPASTSDLVAAGLRISGASNYDTRPTHSNFYYCTDTTSSEFVIGARVASSQTASYYISSNGGVVSQSGLVSLNSTCTKMTQIEAGLAQGYSTSGLSTTGAVANWLQG